MIPVLQERWRVKDNFLIYFGLRRQPDTFKNRIKISSRTAAFIDALDGVRCIEEYNEHRITKEIMRLIEQKIIVDINERIIIPDSFSQARFCVKCCANDFVIPGLELDKEGICPICNAYPEIKRLISPLPVINILPETPSARFDVALFYSGGKDSSYLLYYLCRILGLRVLALTWKHPFMSENALNNIQKAKELLPEVTFVIREAPKDNLRNIYAKCYEQQRNVCICPSLAYILFFPILIDNSVPYLVLGNEPAQSKALIFNRLAPRTLYKPGTKKFLRFLYNAGRMLMLRKPFKEGQLEMYMTIKKLAFGNKGLSKIFGLDNDIINNLFESLAQAPELLVPLQKSVQRSKKDGILPALVHIDFNALSDTGSYDWQSIKKVLHNELNWEDAAKEKGLHTSCLIERCKEYSQLSDFRSMKSEIIPFSALELSIAVIQGSITREKAITEMKTQCGFTKTTPKETKLITDFIKQKNAD